MTPDMNVFRLRRRLPVSYSTQIGRIITRWARLEWQLKSIAYDVLDVGPKRGRIAVREPQAPAYLAMLLQLIRLRRLTISTDTKKLQKLLRALCEYRDKLAHGVWIDHPGTPMPVLAETRGDYPPSQGQKTVSARVMPRSVAVSIKNLRDVVRGMDNAQKTLEAMHGEILAQLAPSPRKRGGRSPAMKPTSRDHQNR